MTRITDVATFNTAKFAATVEDMRAKRESVHEAGERVYRATGKMDPLVGVCEATRRSRNAFVKSDDGTYMLIKGLKLPMFFGTDGTGSFGKQVALLFQAMPIVDQMLAFLRENFQTDISFGVMQDVDDPHDVFQMPEFESSEKMADHMRLLIPDKSGGDSPEDYDLGMYYLARHVETDIIRYGLRGYAIFVLDQVGRGIVRASDVKRHLGQTMQESSLSTKDICTELLTKWHGFVVNVGSDNQAPSVAVTRWWQERIGKNRVIEAEIGLVAEVQVSVVYVTETKNPTMDGLAKVLSGNGSNTKISMNDVKKIWGWLQKAGVPFGEQATLASRVDLPKIGAKFAHIRHVWPIGHPRSNENVIPTDEHGSSSAPAPRKPINWGKF